jgi:hypothetical protein
MHCDDRIEAFAMSGNIIAILQDHKVFLWTVERDKTGALLASRRGDTGSFHRDKKSQTGKKYIGKELSFSEDSELVALALRCENSYRWLL